MYRSVVLMHVYHVSLQGLRVSPSWEFPVPKEMTVNLDQPGSLDLQDSQARLDHRVCATVAEAATKLPSKQVSCKDRSWVY